MATRVSLITGLWSQVKPMFTLPAVGMTIFGGLLAPGGPLWTLAVYSLAVTLAIYTAHVRDTYVDHYLREEDESAPLSASKLRWTSRVTTSLFVGCLVVVWMGATPLAALTLLPLLALMWLHAPVLDTHPFTTTFDYPVGIGCAMLGGYAVRTGSFSTQLVAIATVFVVYLAGTGVQIDLLDYDDDRELGKRTVAVALGPEWARLVATALVIVSMALLVVFVYSGILPTVVVAVAAIPTAAALIGSRRRDAAAFRIQMLATYPFTAGLFLALAF